MSNTFLFKAVLFIQRVLIQKLQFSISIDFVYAQLNVKTVLYQTIQFSDSKVPMSKTVQFQAIQFSISISLNISTQFNSQKHFYFKLFCLIKQFYLKKIQI